MLKGIDSIRSVKGGKRAGTDIPIEPFRIGDEGLEAPAISSVLKVYEGAVVGVVIDRKSATIGHEDSIITRVFEGDITLERAMFELVEIARILSSVPVQVGMKHLKNHHLYNW